jgi:hypothetical protein
MACLASHDRHAERSGVPGRTRKAHSDPGMREALQGFAWSHIHSCRNACICPPDPRTVLFGAHYSAICIRFSFRARIPNIRVRSSRGDGRLCLLRAIYRCRARPVLATQLDWRTSVFPQCLELAPGMQPGIGSGQTQAWAYDVEQCHARGGSGGMAAPWLQAAVPRCASARCERVRKQLQGRGQRSLKGCPPLRCGRTLRRRRTQIKGISVRRRATVRRPGLPRISPLTKRARHIHHRLPPSLSPLTREAGPRFLDEAVTDLVAELKVRLSHTTR